MKLSRAANALISTEEGVSALDDPSFDAEAEDEADEDEAENGEENGLAGAGVEDRRDVEKARRGIVGRDMVGVEIV